MICDALTMPLFKSMDEIFGNFFLQSVYLRNNCICTCSNASLFNRIYYVNTQLLVVLLSQYIYICLHISSCRQHGNSFLCLLMFIFMFSLFQVVQEYERAVIFRLGRLLAGGSKGPGKFFNMQDIFLSIIKKIILFQVSFSYCHALNHIKKLI